MTKNDKKEFKFSEFLLQASKETVIALFAFPVFFIGIMYFVYKLTDMAGGLLYDGSFLYSLLFFFQWSLGFYFFNKQDNFSVRLISWLVFPLFIFITIYLILGLNYIDFVFLYFISYGFIHFILHMDPRKRNGVLNFLYSVINIILESAGKCFAVLFTLLFVMFGVSSIDFYKPVSYEYNEISTAQGLYLSLFNDTNVVAEKDKPDGLISSDNALDIAKSYMYKEHDCRSYSFILQTDNQLISDKNTDDYFYSFVLTGKEYFGAFHTFGFLVNAKTSEISHIEDMSNAD